MSILSPELHWTTYDMAFFGVDLAEDVRVTQQESACTSPVWYMPL
jgi:hypothetical protein